MYQLYKWFKRTCLSRNWSNVTRCACEALNVKSGNNCRCSIYRPTGLTDIPCRHSCCLWLQQSAPPSCGDFSWSLTDAYINYQMISLPLSMLLKPLSWWCSPLHLTSIALLSVLGERSLPCGSLWGFYFLFTLLKGFFSSLSLLLLRVKGRWCHTLLKPYETNCDLWIWAIQIQFYWFIDW